jgi:hypothetical protein
MVASALLLLLLFAMRRGVVGAGFEDSGIGMDDEVVVPERRRVLLRGGRFSASVIVPKDVVTSLGGKPKRKFVDWEYSGVPTWCGFVGCVRL